MQDNPFDEKFMNEAWGKMKSSLDQEMPQRKRRALIWWIFPLLLALSLGVLWSQQDATRQEPIAADMPSSINQNQELNETKDKDLAGKDSKLEKSTAPLNKEEEGLDKAVVTKKTNPTTSTNSFLTFTQTKFSSHIKVDENLNETAPKSEQKISTEEPNPDNNLILLNPLEPIAFLNKNSSNYLINSRVGALSPGLTLAIKATPKPLHLGVFASYDAFPSHNNTGLTTGLYFRKDWRKWYTEVGMGLRFSNSTFEYPEGSIGNSLTASDEMEKPDMALDPSFGGINLNTEISLIEATETSLIVPVHLGFRINQRWSISSGLQLNYLLRMQNRNQELSNSFDTFFNRQGITAEQQPSPDNLIDGFNTRLFIEPSINIHRRFGNKLEMELGYRHGRSSLLKSETYEWNRNRLQLGIRYRLR